MRRQPNVLWLFSAFIALANAAPALGQQDPPRGVCWRGPTAACEVILLTEIGFHRVVTATHRTLTFEGSTGPPAATRGLGSYLTWQLGLLRPLDRRMAVGGTFEIGGSEEGPRAGMHVRGRRFITEHSAVELSAGIVRGNVSTFASTEGRGFNLGARFNLDDKLMLVIGYDDFGWPKPRRSDVIYLDDTSRARALTLGAAAGSWPAAISTAVVGVAYVLLAFALAGST